jgi:hypothetical protein
LNTLGEFFKAGCSAVGGLVTYYREILRRKTGPRLLTRGGICDSGKRRPRR